MVTFVSGDDQQAIIYATLNTMTLLLKRLRTILVTVCNLAAMEAGIFHAPTSRIDIRMVFIIEWKIESVCSSPFFLTKRSDR